MMATANTSGGGGIKSFGLHAPDRAGGFSQLNRYKKGKIEAKKEMANAIS
jgi:hypothetical protein